MNTVFKFTSFYLIISLLISCCTLVSAQQKPIIIIFHHFPNELNYTFPSGLVRRNIDSAAISYISGNHIRFFNSQKETDTLVINSRDERIEVCHIIKATEKRYFLFKAGDTIDFSYNNFIPFVNSRKNPELNKLYNFESMYCEKFNTPFSLNPFIILDDQYFKAIYKARKEFPSIYENRKQEYFDRDTLVQTCMDISEFWNTFIKSNTTNENLWLVDYLKYKKVFLDLKLCNANNNDTLDFHYLLHDSLMPFISYRNYLRELNIYYRDAVITDEKALSQQNQFDYLKIYELIKNDKTIPEKTRFYLLSLAFNWIVDSPSTNIKQIQWHLDDYRKFTNDTATISAIKEKYGIDFSKTNLMALRGINNEQFDFKSVIENYRGKVVYVDFWASWCAPCRKAMASAKKLRSQLSGEDVVFIYIAINDQMDNWKKAVIQEDTQNGGVNYLVENPKTSQLIKDLEIQAIPRYLIFDKNGELAYRNAPGPDNPEIINILNNLLNP